MFGFGKKRREREYKPRKNNGFKHGLRFDQNNTNWTIDMSPSSKKNMIIAGEDRIDVARKVISALHELNIQEDIMTRSDQIDGVHDWSDHDLQSSVSIMTHDALLSMTKATPSDDHDQQVNHLLVLEGWEASLKNAEENHSDQGTDQHYDQDCWSTAQRLSAMVLSQDVLTAIIDFIQPGSDSDALHAPCPNTTSASVCLLALSMIDQQSDDKDILTIESISNECGEDVALSVALLMSQVEGEPLFIFASRLRYNRLAVEAAPSFFRSGPGLGLNIEYSGSADQVKKAIAVLRPSYDPFASLDGPSRQFMMNLYTLMTIAASSGFLIVLVSDGSIPVLIPLMPQIQVRIIAGSLPDDLHWLIGSDVYRSAVNPRDGIITVCSAAYDNAFKMSTSTAISPEFMTDRTMITLM
jgi:hypothetical protein